MNTVTIEGGMLRVEPMGLDKLWSFRGELVVPLAHVRGVTVDTGIAAEPKGLRAPGLGLPGKWAGTFHRDGEASFWNVSDPHDNVVIQLADEHYTRLVLTVADPSGLEREVTAAIGA